MKNKVDETIRIFNLQVDKQMLPQGVGTNDRRAIEGALYAEIPKMILGSVQECNFEVETGQAAAEEKIYRFGTGFERDPDPPLQLQSHDYSTLKQKWDELRIAKNKSKFNAKTLRLVRDELDNLLKKSEGADLDQSRASSGNSTSTWASFAPIPEEGPLSKIIPGYFQLSDEQKVDALKNELPPFDINDTKYANLKFALGLI